MTGKGSGRRPLRVELNTFESNWDKIFKNKDEYCDAHDRKYEDGDCVDCIQAIGEGEQSQYHTPIPRAIVKSFGGDGHGWSLIVADAFPHAYKALDSDFVLSCEVSWTHADRGHYRDTLENLVESNHLDHETGYYEPVMVHPETIMDIVKWAASVGAVQDPTE